MPRTVRSGRLACAIAAIALCAIGSVARAQREDQLIIRRSSASGAITFISAKDGGPLPLDGVPLAERKEPSNAAAAYSRVLSIADPARQLSLTRSYSDSLGHTHSLFQQMHGGIPVFSGVLKVHQNERGEVHTINGRFYPLPKDFPALPAIGSAEAVRIALRELEATRPEIVRSELTIVDPGWYGDAPLGPRLAWHVAVYDSAAGIHEAFFVDAISGKILDRWSELHTVLERRIHDGEGGTELPAFLARAEGEPPFDSGEVDRAYEHIGDTYEYFRRAFGRDSLDDAGMPLIATVNSVAFGCPNAVWDDRRGQAIFCTGTTSDDIVAHELTHGITSRTAALIYQNQPGQLNESFSDVFGEMVDWFNGIDRTRDPDEILRGAPEAGMGIDRPISRRTEGCNFPPRYPDGVRWMVGEDAHAFGGAIRDMWAPTCYGMPDRANHQYQLCQFTDNGGVHFGSSVPNHAFALATDGGDFNGLTIFGIGSIKAAAVWYRALTHYISPADNFEDAYHAFNRAALDLIGTYPNDPRTGQPVSRPFTLFHAEQIALALQATEMNTPGRCGVFPDLLDSRPPPSCPGRTLVYRDDFESGPGGWTWRNSAPLTPYDWMLVAELPRMRPGAGFFVADPPIGDCTDRDESGVHSLISPVITLPFTRQTPFLQFAHFVATERGYDGGNIRIQVNGADWLLVEGSDFVFNPYNTVFRRAEESNTSPLAGQEGWTHAGGDWAVSIINLSRLAKGGDRIQLRFDFGKDGCDGVQGWYIDEVEIFVCPDCNRDGVNDIADNHFIQVSQTMRSIGIGQPAHTPLPPLLPAMGDVTLTFWAIADLAQPREDFEVRLNGAVLGVVFGPGEGRDCPTEADKDSLVIPAALFNQLTADRRENVIELVASADVNHEVCGIRNHARVVIEYLPAMRDANENRVPDECEDCAVALTPEREPLGFAKNRYISIVPNQAPGRRTAWQVSGVGFSVMGDVPSRTLWVDRPWRVQPQQMDGEPFGPGAPGLRAQLPLTAELPLRGEPHFGPERLPVETHSGLPIALARLSCEPVFCDWGLYSVVHVGDRAIVPGRSYGVRALDVACLRPDASVSAGPMESPFYSGRLSLPTVSAWGDLVGKGPGLPPDGVVNALDVAAAIDILNKQPDALSFEHADLFPQDPDGIVDIIDVSKVIDGRSGLPYPFSATPTCR